MKIQIVYYFDVWGNEEDGFEVNNLTVHSTKEVESFPYEKTEILALLKETGLINKDVTEDMILTQEDENWVEVSEPNGKPFCRIVEEK